MVPLNSAQLSAVSKLYSVNKLISQRYNLLSIQKIFVKLHVSAQDIQRLHWDFTREITELKASLQNFKVKLFLQALQAPVHLQKLFQIQQEIPFLTNKLQVISLSNRGSQVEKVKVTECKIEI